MYLDRYSFSRFCDLLSDRYSTRSYEASLSLCCDRIEKFLLDEGFVFVDYPSGGCASRYYLNLFVLIGRLGVRSFRYSPLYRFYKSFFSFDSIDEHDYYSSLGFLYTNYLKIKPKGDTSFFCAVVHDIAVLYNDFLSGREHREVVLLDFPF